MEGGLFWLVVDLDHGLGTGEKVQHVVGGLEHLGIGVDGAHERELGNLGKHLCGCFLINYT